MIKRRNCFLLIYVMLLLTIDIVYAQGRNQRNVPAFNGVKVFGDINVNIKQGPTQLVKVRAHGVDIEKVITYVDDGLLKIKMQEGLYNDIDVEVDITYINLIEINAAGSAKIEVSSEVRQSKLYVDVNSAAYIRLNVDLEAIKINLHSGGELDISGKVLSQQIRVVSGAQLNALRLESEHVSIKTNTGGMAEIYAEDSIDGTAATGGSIRYKGNPKIVNVKGTLGGNISRY